MINFNQETLMSDTNSGSFAVAYDRIQAVIERFGLIEACHYLLYCCGRKGTLEATRWSRNSALKYAGIPTRSAQKSEMKLISGGFVHKVKTGKHPEFAIAPSTTGEHLWLPKTFVTGTKEGEPSPLMLIKQTGYKDVLRLMLDIYWRKDIFNEGGFGRIYTPFERSVKLADHGAFSVYGFNELDRMTAEDDFASTYHDCISTVASLIRMGLVFEVPYLFDSQDGMPMFPLNNPYTQEELTSLTGIAIDVLPDEYDYNASIHNYCLMVPSHMQAPVVRTVLFTRYRQQTELMKAGYSTTINRIEEWECLYQRLIKDKSKTLQGQIKDNSINVLSSVNADKSWAYD
jgi:hypothetical protein